MEEKFVPKKNPVKQRVGAIIVGGVICLVLGSGFAAFVFLDPWQWLLKRSRYEGIVHRIESIGIRAGEERTFLVSFDKDPMSLQPVVDLLALEDHYEKLVRGEVVQAHRWPNGRLVVRIRMPGRRPNYEVVYSSDEPNRGEIDNHGMAKTKRLAEHWWATEDRSD
jgi:hypothetical protein